MADDLIRDVVRRVLEMHPGTSEDQLLRLELTLRRVWGGTEHYICKKPTLGKVSSLTECLTAGGSVPEAFVFAGVSRRHGYRLFARRARWMDY